MHYDSSRVIDLKNIDLNELLERANINKAALANGDGIDTTKFFKPSEIEDPSALFLAAMIFQQGYGHAFKDAQGNKIDAVNWLASYECAKRGAQMEPSDPLCAALYAIYHFMGVGGPTNIEVAKEIADFIHGELKAMADRKPTHPYAATLLAAMYERELGTGSLPKAQVTQEIKGYYKLAADMGEPEACSTLVYFLRNSSTYVKPEEMDKLLQPAIDMAHAQGQYTFGEIYLKTPGKVEEAIRLMKASAEQGLVTAQYRMGQWYEGAHFKGSKADPAQAFYWHEKAATLGHTKSKLALARCYDRGTGTPKNPAKALELYSDLLSVQPNGRLAFIRRLTSEADEKGQPKGKKGSKILDETSVVETRITLLAKEQPQTKTYAYTNPNDTPVTAQDVEILNLAIKNHRNSLSRVLIRTKTGKEIEVDGEKLEKDNRDAIEDLVKNHIDNKEDPLTKILISTADDNLTRQIIEAGVRKSMADTQDEAAMNAEIKNATDKLQIVLEFGKYPGTAVATLYNADTHLARTLKGQRPGRPPTGSGKPKPAKDRHNT